MSKKLIIPNTTPEEPLIEFRIDKTGKIKLSKTSNWWGGINHSFSSTDGTEGNSCEPENLKAYIKAFKKKKIKTIENEIVLLQKKLKVLLSETDNWHF